MNDKDKSAIALEYVNFHKVPFSEWTANLDPNNTTPLLTIYYQLLTESDVDEFDSGLRVIEISARESKNNHPILFEFDNELESVEILNDDYDIEAIKIDIQNNNFDESLIHTYHKCAIVAESIANGQRKQAKEQMKRYDLTFSDIVDHCPELNLRN